jgi:hypothetical protein
VTSATWIVYGLPAAEEEPLTAVADRLEAEAEESHVQLVKDVARIARKVAGKSPKPKEDEAE